MCVKTQIKQKGLTMIKSFSFGIPKMPDINLSGIKNAFDSVADATDSINETLKGASKFFKRANKATETVEDVVSDIDGDAVKMTAEAAIFLFTMGRVVINFILRLVLKVIEWSAKFIQEAASRVFFGAANVAAGLRMHASHLTFGALFLVLYFVWIWIINLIITLSTLYVLNLTVAFMIAVLSVIVFRLYFGLIGLMMGYIVPPSVLEEMDMSEDMAWLLKYYIVPASALKAVFGSLGNFFGSAEFYEAEYILNFYKWRVERLGLETDEKYILLIAEYEEQLEYLRTKASFVEAEALEYIETLAL